MSATGNYVPAVLAARIGLVNEVVAHEELLPRALSLASDIAGSDPGVLATIRSLYDAGAAHGAAAAHEGERLLWDSGAALADPKGVAIRRTSVMDRGRAQRMSSGDQ